MEPDKANKNKCCISDDLRAVVNQEGTQGKGGFSNGFIPKFSNCGHVA